MATSVEKQSFTINLISLNCHLPISEKGQDRIYLVYEGKRLYPKGRTRYLQFGKGDAHKFENASIKVTNMVQSQAIMVELWRYNWLWTSKLIGRFFFITNISEVGFSATQLIRNSEYGQSNYLLHWEKRDAVERIVTEEDAKARELINAR
jgi:hypothetical protein